MMQQLTKNAAHCPHVHCCCLEFCTQQELWCAVPQRHNYRRHGLVRVAKLPSQTKISWNTENVSKVKPYCLWDEHASVCITSSKENDVGCIGMYGKTLVCQVRVDFRGVMGFTAAHAIVAKIVRTISPSPLPPPPQFNIEISSFRSGEATQLCTGGGSGIISSPYMNSSVWKWSTEFVVSILSMIVDYEAAFQLILTRIVAHIYESTPGGFPRI